MIEVQFEIGAAAIAGNYVAYAFVFFTKVAV